MTICRCGELVCDACSLHRRLLPHISQERVRLCDVCEDKIQSLGVSNIRLLAEIIGATCVAAPTSSLSLSFALRSHCASVGMGLHRARTALTLYTHALTHRAPSFSSFSSAPRLSRSPPSRFARTTDRCRFRHCDTRGASFATVNRSRRSSNTRRCPLPRSPSSRQSTRALSSNFPLYGARSDANHSSLGAARAMAEEVAASSRNRDAEKTASSAARTASLRWDWIKSRRAAAAARRRRPGGAPCGPCVWSAAAVRASRVRSPE